ncbi:Rossmann-like and DUF2520 domain-containing protein [Aureibaculum conchae]|uniref:Rossmann-like and DUF2520 domain-containing protein n=1 Tax=Aureibaculum sp. 2308TA14-22 TaxID=3108392 RepID=UPI0033966DE7
MISVVILGSGNVANHLTKVFYKADGIHLQQVYARNKSSLNLLNTEIETTDNLSKLADADVYIIAISDDSISEFSAQLNLKNKLVVHTSGSASISALKATANKGVFYPVQTFSVLHNVDFSEVPVCIETENNDDLLLLEKVASSITKHVYFIDSAQRKYLHISAVFINNFVNHIYKAGYDICAKNSIPFQILHPLIIETAEKITHINPSSVQTGPAKRGDKKTINKHLKLLDGKEKEIYDLLTQSIQKTYGKKL